MLDSRASGILLHPTSLPGPFGIGDIGPAAHTWVDWLAETGGTDIPLSDNTLREAPLDEYRRKGEAYTEAADACRQAGITLSYHNY